jgi:hypothetical protein
MAAATSPAVTSRPMGWRAASAARSAAGSGEAPSSRSTHGVSTVPGFTQLTLIPSATWSAAMASVRAKTAPLLAQYSARCGSPAVPAIELVLTMTASPRSRTAWRSSGRAALGVLCGFHASGAVSIAPVADGVDLHGVLVLVDPVDDPVGSTPRGIVAVERLI